MLASPFIRSWRPEHHGAGATGPGGRTSGNHDRFADRAVALTRPDPQKPEVRPGCKRCATALRVTAAASPPAGIDGTARVGRPGRRDDLGAAVGRTGVARAAAADERID